MNKKLLVLLSFVSLNLLDHNGLSAMRRCEAAAAEGEGWQCCRCERMCESGRGFCIVCGELKGNTWSCFDCGHKNRKDFTRCCSCRVEKPIFRIVPRAVAVDAESAHDGWRCDVCFTSNKADATKCKECENEKF